MKSVRGLPGCFCSEALTSGVQADGGIRFTQKTTHSQVATRIGTVREVFTRILWRLRSQDFVIVKGKEIIIPDFATFADYTDSEKNL